MLFLKILGVIGILFIVKVLLQKYLSIYIGTYATENHQHFYIYTAKEGMLLKKKESDEVFILSGRNEKGLFTIYGLEDNKMREGYCLEHLLEHYVPVKT